VFAGSLRLLTGEWKIQGFQGGASMGRYLFDAPLIDFGGMLAGACAVGAGVTGGAVFALTAWLALAAMWAVALGANYLVDERSVDSTIPKEAIGAA
jgi:uncharacterized protein